MLRLILIFGYKLRNKLWRLLNTVTIGVRIIAIRDKKVLLVHHTYLDGWHFPGGGVHSGETLNDAARREVYEEAGVIVDKMTLIGAYTDFTEGRTDHKVLFSGVVIEQKERLSKEILEIEYFPLHSLPEDLSDQCRHRIQEFLSGDYPKYGIW